MNLYIFNMRTNGWYFHGLHNSSAGNAKMYAQCCVVKDIFQYCTVNFLKQTFGSKVVWSLSRSLGVKSTTQENAKDNSRHFDLWFWSQCGVQNTVLLGPQHVAQCCIGESRDFLLFKVDIVVHVKCLLFPPLHFPLLRNCCENHGFNIEFIGSFPVAAF